MGKLCSACHEELPKAKFSSKQWGASDANKRRCKNCTSNNVPSRPLPKAEETQATQQPRISNNKSKFHRKEPIDYIDEESARQKLLSLPDDISCWICLEEKDISSGSRPLLRDCCCRGDYSGWAHYECLSK